MSAEERTDEPITFSPLIADILTASITQTQDTTNRLIESLQIQLSYERARSAAVASCIYGLCSGDWMPTTRAIIRALNPTEDEIERFKEEAGE